MHNNCLHSNFSQSVLRNTALAVKLYGLTARRSQRLRRGDVTSTTSVHSNLPAENATT